LDYYESSGLAADHPRDSKRERDCQTAAAFTANGFDWQKSKSPYSFEAGRYRALADDIAENYPADLKYAGRKKLTAEDIDAFIGVITRLAANGMETQEKQRERCNSVGPPDSGGSIAPFSAHASRASIIGLWRYLYQNGHIHRSINRDKYRALYNLCVKSEALSLYSEHIKPKQGQRGRGRLIGPGPRHPDYDKFKHLQNTNSKRIQQAYCRK
jgi:hypothetical protein